MVNDKKETTGTTALAVEWQEQWGSAYLFKLEARGYAGRCGREESEDDPICWVQVAE